MCLPRLTVNTFPRLSPNVHSGYQAIMMCQCQFITSNKYTTLVRDVGNEDDWGWTGSTQELSVCSSNCAVNLKCFLKKCLKKEKEKTATQARCNSSHLYPSTLDSGRLKQEDQKFKSFLRSGR